MGLRLRDLLAGAGATALIVVAAAGWVRAAGGERTISLYNIHTKETVTVAYKRDGKFIPEGLEKVNHAMRDWRKNETIKMDPELIDLLWEMHAELGSKEPIHVICGYRSRATNEMLRKTVGGQASESRHIQGKAADVTFPDVPLKNLRYSALVREKGGVGYYPTSGIPFVHVDTDRVRAWPRLPRHELALLFPSGHTKHAPADGGSITREDVRVAQSKYKDLAVQIAQFLDDRGSSKSATAVADASRAKPAADEGRITPVKPGATIASLEASKFSALPASDRHKLDQLAALAIREPQLVAGPAPAKRPNRALPSLTGTPGPAPLPELKTAEPKPTPRLAALTPSNGAGTLSDAGRGWVPAPAWDEEHPEELSYRPFPIGPLLTASPTEPVMSELIQHDVARTLDFIDQPGAFIPLRFRPGEQTATLLWAQQFTGEAIGLSKLEAAKSGSPTPLGFKNRAVKTTQK